MGTEPSSNSKTNNKGTLKSNSLGDPRQKPYRHRLYSDPQEMPQDKEKLQPIRRHSNINVGNLQSNLSNSLNNTNNNTIFNFNDSNNNNNNNQNVLPKFERSQKRKMSEQYYAQFRKKHSGNSDFISHLVGSLNSNKDLRKLTYEE